MDRATGYWWSPDGATIAYQETDERHIPLYSIVHQGGEKISVETHRYPFSRRPTPRFASVSVSAGEEPHAGSNLMNLARTFISPGSTGPLPSHSWFKSSLAIRSGSGFIGLISETLGKTLLIEETSETWVNLHHVFGCSTRPARSSGRPNAPGFATCNCTTRTGNSCGRSPTVSGPWMRSWQLDEKRREVWFAAGRETPLEFISAGSRSTGRSGPAHE